MAEALGEALVLGSPVARIVSDQRTVVQVESAPQGLARRVLVAMMPADTGHIEFIPELPPGRRGLVKAGGLTRRQGQRDL